jgi:hypothetical protein
MQGFFVTVNGFIVQALKRHPGRNLEMPSLRERAKENTSSLYGDSLIDDKKG